ncbi:hypothetical protein GEMRC1_007020 [Eukaryota sp. GEM-RC1]
MYLASKGISLNDTISIKPFSPETSSLIPSTSPSTSPWDSSFFDVVDIDPFGSASPFVDAAIAAVRPGGLLCITSTDQAVLVGQYTDKCFTKYQSVPMHTSCCKESSVRSLLTCVMTAAAKVDRIITPLLSLNVDFYVRCFVRVDRRGNPKVMARQMIRTAFCNSCHSFFNENLVEPNNSNRLLPGHREHSVCPVCDGKLREAGPYWGDVAHSSDFVQEMLRVVEDPKCGEGFPYVTTTDRIRGILTMAKDELEVKTPFYYSLDRMCSVLKISSPPSIDARSALLNKGFLVCQWHGDRKAFKTNAPWKTVWSMVVSHGKEFLKGVEWDEKDAKYHKRAIIFSKDWESDWDWSRNDGALLSSRKTGVKKFPQNPEPYWGPGSLPTNDKKLSDRKRRSSEDSEEKKLREEE